MFETIEITGYIYFEMSVFLLDFGRPHVKFGEGVDKC